MRAGNPKLLFLVLAVVCVAGLAFAAVWMWELSVLWAILIGLNIITFLFYGIDKSSSARGGLRIPEVILHLLALLGGSPAALLGQMVFRHKTRKWKFRIVFVLIILVQIAAVVFYMKQKSL